MYDISVSIHYSSIFSIISVSISITIYQSAWYTTYIIIQNKRYILEQSSSRNSLQVAAIPLIGIMQSSSRSNTTDRYYAVFKSQHQARSIISQPIDQHMQNCNDTQSSCTTLNQQQSTRKLHQRFSSYSSTPIHSIYSMQTVSMR